MFGTLAPHRCRMQEGEQERYDQFYCGLCKALGDHYGQALRGTLSHDSVFMALLADALLVQGAPDGSCRCPLLPVRIRKTVDSRSVAMRYAAAVQLLLGDQWLADKEQEGRRGFATARQLFASHVAHARTLLEELGIDTSALVGFEQRQRQEEERENPTPEEAAAPTAEALGILFAQLGSLPGTVLSARTEETKEQLRALGRAVGRSIYLLDALEDLRGDFLSNSFNPCVVTSEEGTREVSSARIAECTELLRGTLRSFPRLLRSLPLQRNAAVLEHVLLGRFSQRAYASMVFAERSNDPLLLGALKRVREGAWIERSMLRASVFFFTLFVLLGKNTEVWAQRVGRRAGRALQDAGSTTPGLVEETFTNASVVDLPTSTTVFAVDGGVASAVSTPSVGRTIERISPGRNPGGSQARCGDPCAGCGSECNKGCGDCGNCCNGSSNGCRDCGKGCNDCGNCCNACNDCGKGCNDCGNCCNGCGNSCNGCRC